MAGGERGTATSAIWNTTYRAVRTTLAPILISFYAFRFSVMWGQHLADPTTALQACRDANRGMLTFRAAAPA